MNNICNLCPNLCNVLRYNKKGACGEYENVRIAKYYLHPYEEPPISGTNGSGTIFFSGCSLKCVFCQNYDLSRSNRGKIISTYELADVFKQLEEKGAHNINLVNPTHFSDKIIKALKIYKPNIPIVYNTHGYENLCVLKEIDEYVDIYLPDLKFFSPEVSLRYSKHSDYFEVAKNAISFMVNKPIKFSSNGLMQSGTIVRHLVLPNNVSDSKNILNWFKEYKDKAFLHIMSQYTPYGEIDSYPELKRKITKREYETVIDYAISLNIEKLFYQDIKSASENFIPSWDY